MFSLQDKVIGLWKFFLEKKKIENKRSGNYLLIFGSATIFCDNSAHNLRQTRNSVADEVDGELFGSFVDLGEQAVHVLTRLLQFVEVFPGDLFEFVVDKFARHTIVRVRGIATFSAMSVTRRWINVNSCIFEHFWCMQWRLALIVPWWYNIKMLFSVKLSPSSEKFRFFFPITVVSFMNVLS